MPTMAIDQDGGDNFHYDVLPWIFWTGSLLRIENFVTVCISMQMNVGVVRRLHGLYLETKVAGVLSKVCINSTHCVWIASFLPSPQHTTCLPVCFCLPVLVTVFVCLLSVSLAVFLSLLCLLRVKRMTLNSRKRGNYWVLVRFPSAFYYVKFWLSSVEIFVLPPKIFVLPPRCYDRVTFYVHGGRWKVSASHRRLWCYQSAFVFILTGWEMFLCPRMDVRLRF